MNHVITVDRKREFRAFVLQTLSNEDHIANSPHSENIFSKRKPDDMARGKAKLKKVNRASISSATKTFNANIDELTKDFEKIKQFSQLSSQHKGDKCDGKWLDHLGTLLHHTKENDEDENVYICEHRDLNFQSMKYVSIHLSELFTTSFQMALPMLYHEKLQLIQIEVVRSTMLSLTEDGIDLKKIRDYANSKETEKRIKSHCMRSLDNLSVTISRISTEDTFDLVCDLAARHGRDLVKLGPPCACSFAHCLGCLATLAESVRETPAMQPKMKKTISQKDLANTIKYLFKRDKVDEVGSSSDTSIDLIAEAWHSMDSVFWKVADSIDPMQIPCIKNAYDKLKRINGLALWYAVAARELKFIASSGSKGKAKRESTDFSQDDVTTSAYIQSIAKAAVKYKTSKVDSKIALAISGRKFLGKICKDQGNLAFERSLFIEAAEHYTRGIGYDAESAVLSLNRAQCMIQLERFKEAEEDCSTAILLDVKNYKGWCRRAMSRFNQGKIEEAKSDLERALSLSFDNEKMYNNLLDLCENILGEGIKKNGKEAFHDKQWRLPSFDEIMDRRKQNERPSMSNSKRSDSISTDSCTSTNSSVGEVFTQVSFAIAFNQVVHQNTGINVQVPISCWNKPRKVSNASSQTSSI